MISAVENLRLYRKIWGRDGTKPRHRTADVVATAASISMRTSWGCRGDVDTSSRFYVEEMTS